MVVHEFLPLLHERGLRTNRIALLGYSMGGYGSLYLSGVLGRRRVYAAVAESPAIWPEAARARTTPSTTRRTSIGTASSAVWGG
jgi:S-formylglutathione hydrolase FrmB